MTSGTGRLPRAAEEGRAAGFSSGDHPSGRASQKTQEEVQAPNRGFGCKWRIRNSVDASRVPIWMVHASCPHDNNRNYYFYYINNDIKCISVKFVLTIS